MGWLQGFVEVFAYPTELRGDIIDSDLIYIDVFINNYHLCH